MIRNQIPRERETPPKLQSQIIRVFHGIHVFMVFVMLPIALPAITTYAQTLQANIRGQMEDASGYPLPNVLVRAINEETNDTRQTYTSPEGEYTFSTLRPGLYRIEAELSGFSKYIEPGIQVSVGQNLRLNIVLHPGGPSNEIIVIARQDLVAPDATHEGAVIDNRQIVNFPLEGRNFLELSLLTPGTAPAAQGSPGSVRGEFAINVSGAREDSNNFVLDGAFNNDPKLNSVAINPPVDAIREYEVLTSTYDASFGRSAGAQVNVVSKSGTNGFHGTAYEFFRNGALDANNFFERSETGDARYQRNQFGFSLGGPLRKDHTFFFADYEGRRVREGITRVTNVPTEQERNGDFSQSLFSHPINPFTQSGFENDRIPSDQINPTGSAIANLYPIPNRSVPYQNYVSSPILSDRDDRFDVRVDHAFTAKSSLMVRYSFSDRDLYEPFSGPTFASVPGFGVHVPRRAQNILIGHDYVFSSSFINQARFAVNRVAFGSFQERRESSLNQAVGLPELSSNPRDYGLSFITVSGFSPIGDEYNNPQHSVTNVFQISDTLSLSKSKHLIRFGFDIRILQQNAYRDVQSRGMMAFSDYGQVTGNGLADLLLGYMTYSGGAHLDNPQYLRTQSYNFFIHDSYRLRRDLTLQLGLRYEYNSPPVDRYDRANTYDPDSQSLVPVGKGGIPRSVYLPDRNNWAPRIGIAWSPDAANRIAVHAGYGIYYDQSALAPGEGLYFNKPYYDFKYYFPLPGLPLTVNDPFPAGYPLSIPSTALGFDRKLRTPYIQQWNVAFEQQFGRDSHLEIAYVGSKGIKLIAARDINQPAPSPLQPNPRPVLQFADIIYLESRAGSTYNSLQARFEQRLRAGASALVSYTFGKSLDEASTFFSSYGDSNFPQNSADPGDERGRSNFDLRHRFSLGYSLELPFGRGKRLLADRGLISEILAGWSTYGIITLQSGQPFTVALLPENDNSNTGFASLGFGANNRPDRIASGKLSNPGPDAWFDDTAFVLAERGSFGNSGRNILDGPAYQDFSLSLLKDTRIREGLDLQFRAEFFNAFNHANFDLPDSFLGSSTFGRINSAKNPRLIQFGLKIIY
jgi:hypothetical protein